MKLIGIIGYLFIIQTSFAQNEETGKAEIQRTWPVECKKAEIVSSADQAIQPAYFFHAKSDQPRPLVVRLHAWSADYTKVDGVAQLCIDNDYNYIHPNFRGPSDRPEACGNPLVIPNEICQLNKYNETFFNFHHIYYSYIFLSA